MAEQEPGRTNSPIDSIRTPEDFERLLSSAGDELINLAFVGKMFGLSTPETDAQLSQIAANIAGAAQNFERAKTSLA